MTLLANTTIAGLDQFYHDVHAANVKAGWWSDINTGEPKKRSVGEMFMLIVTELAEAFAAYATDAQDDTLPRHHGLGVELADVQIRLADFIGALQAGRIVHMSNAINMGEQMFRDVACISDAYEAIRKTPAAVGEPETGDFIPTMDVVRMIADKAAQTSKIENRLKDGGKRT